MSSSQEYLFKRSISLILFLGLSAVVWGQEVQITNELDNFRLYGKAKLETLFLKTSTRGDVVAVFGKDCDWIYCEYDANWQVMFVYLEPYMRRYRTEGPIEVVLAPFPQFFDRLWLIKFQPKGEHRFDLQAMPRNFSSEEIDMIHSGTPTLVFRDGKGLIYILDNTEESRGILFSIEYYVPPEAAGDVFFPIQMQTEAGPDYN